MKVNFISYLDPFVYNGGGEAIMRGLLCWAKRYKEYKFKFFHTNPRKREFFTDADISIVCDYFNNPTSLRHRPDLSFLEEIIGQGRFIHFDNAYVDSCSMGALPCDGEQLDLCPAKIKESFWSKLCRRDFSPQCFQKNPIIEDLYSRSLSNIFLSPLHQITVTKMLGIEGKENYILRPLIETNLFYNQQRLRDIEYLFVGAIGEAKGLENMRAWCRERGVRPTIVGPKTSGVDLGFANYLGYIPRENLPELYNRAKNFLYLPRWPEPQGRVVVEAALCGCQLITNDNVGATSFNFDLSDPKNLENVEANFWEYVENLI